MTAFYDSFSPILTPGLNSVEVVFCAGISKNGVKNAIICLTDFYNKMVLLFVVKLVVKILGEKLFCFHLKWSQISFCNILLKEILFFLFLGNSEQKAIDSDV